MPDARILVVDDEPAILNVVVSYLKADGYAVHTAGDGPAALKAVRAFKPDLVILDLMLPGLDGLEVLARLRRESGVYVILLTARADETDKIIGLSVGADDYVTKPFSPRELAARVRAALRRQQGGAGDGADVLVFGGLRIDTGTRQVVLEDKKIELTAIEFDLLRALAAARGRVLTREQLLEQVWGCDYFGETRLVDVHLGHIRQKLGPGGWIATVRGVGYRFEEAPR